MNEAPELELLSIALVDERLFRSAKNHPRMWRVCSLTHGSASFDGRDKRGRFSPIRDSTGQVVPVIYASTSLQSALLETVLRAPEAGRRSQLRRHQLNGLGAATLRFKSTLKLAVLHGPAANHLLGDGVIDSLRSTLDYQRSAEWGQKIYSERSDCNGLEWRSRQDDGELNWMIWQQADAEFDASAPRPLLKPYMLTKIRELAMKLNVIWDEDLDR